MKRNLFENGAILRLIGLMLCTFPVITSVILYFPLWNTKGDGAVVSGFSILLIIIALIPFFRFIKERISRISAPALWLALFLLFFTVSKIADEMTVISFIGFIGNLAGSFFFKAARRKDGSKNNEEQ